MPETFLNDATPRWLLGQIASFIALGLFIAGFASKDDRKLLLILMAANTAVVAQFALLGSWVASAMTGIVILRILLARHYHGNYPVMISLLLLTIIAACFTWQGWSDAPALIAGLLGTIAMFLFHGIVLRWWLFTAAFFWVLSNLVAGAIGGIIAEALVMIMNLVTIWRLRKDAQQHPSL
ncbi:membrane protein [Thalassospira profundimaris]|uniref:Membrane protein n=1 Tax=Thalassospira profundimaris TaxID=502049 RepID=A0A367X457_9PROT|nr:YgjV family protein [Thalassospira profundimaris]RCK48367.1 membrane protein [Thalassospira profundimaris]